MSIKITVDGQELANTITGYRLISGLVREGALFTVFQFICEDHVSYNATAGQGRPGPSPLFAAGGALPVRGTAVPVTCQRPILGDTTHSMTLNGCEIIGGGADRRIRGEIATTLVSLKVTGDIDRQSPPVDELEDNSAGEVNFRDNWFPVLDIDSSSTVLSIRYWKNEQLDAFGWLSGYANQKFHLDLRYRFNEQAGECDLPGTTQNVQKGIVVEEVCGRFSEANRVAASYWKAIFAAGLEIEKLPQSLEDILPLPMGSLRPTQYGPGGDVEERLSIVFKHGIDFPNW